MGPYTAVRRCTLLTLGMLFGGVAGASAQQAMMQPGGRAIEVVGVGEVEVAPDEATLNFAVETSAPTSQEAAQQNAQRMEAVIAAFVAAGIPRNEIETRNFSIYPEYVTDDRGENPQVRAYRVSNQVSFQTTDLEEVGSLIDTGIAAGANRIDGISFGLRNPQAAEAEALREAVANARASAETLAQALGVPLGPVMHASTSTDPIRPIPLMMRRGVAMEAAQAFDTPIQPGQQTVQARVTLVFGVAN